MEEEGMSVLDRWNAIIDRRDQHSRLFGEMMRRFGLCGRDRSFSLTDGLALGRAARVCLDCRAVERCQVWTMAGGPLAEAERFCPNASLFRELGQLDEQGEIEPVG
jgi:hypothetical protein